MPRLIFCHTSVRESMKYEAQLNIHADGYYFKLIKIARTHIRQILSRTAASCSTLIRKVSGLRAGNP